MGGGGSNDGCNSSATGAIVSVFGAIPGVSCIVSGVASVLYAGSDERAVQRRAGGDDGRVKVVVRVSTAALESAAGCLPGVSQASR
jgi:hypothetical protein